ncbi:hypothetical protein PVAP13_8KG324010 [Panicum virgatum]|uniref:Uncharacterized protein n=1 Tax=Panicum virgatum TaxID=38727 RepID=A0A8T0PR80_PANVG|nr:hypothetical protein PVAP13_8KG324010 [Panicum virgatum]
MGQGSVSPVRRTIISKNVGGKKVSIRQRVSCNRLSRASPLLTNQAAAAAARVPRIPSSTTLVATNLTLPCSYPPSRSRSCSARRILPNPHPRSGSLGSASRVLRDGRQGKDGEQAPLGGGVPAGRCAPGRAGLRPAPRGPIQAAALHPARRPSCRLPPCAPSTASRRPSPPPLVCLLPLILHVRTAILVPSRTAPASWICRFHFHQIEAATAEEGNLDLSSSGSTRSYPRSASDA